MNFIVEYIAVRLLDAWLAELDAWRIRAIQVGPNEMRWVALDEYRHKGEVLEISQPIPNYIIQRYDFGSEKEAEALIDRKCACAAARHLLCFWRPQP